MNTLIGWYANDVNIKRLSTYLRRYIRVNGLFKTQDDVNFTIEDVIQTAFLNLYRKGQDYIKKHTIHASIDTLVFTAAINNALSEIRTKKRQKTFSLEDFEKYDSINIDAENLRFYLNLFPDPATIAENNELREDVYNSIGRLREIYREPFLLWMQGYTYNQISGILETPEGTVKSKICRAKKMLRFDRCIKKHYEAIHL